jgi:molybdenum cofactor cytidylyltransferase
MMWGFLLESPPHSPIPARFGRPKALLTLSEQNGQSRTLLDCAIGQGRLLSRDVRVVCGAWYPLVRFRCRAQPSLWVPVADWQLGMAASLAAGIRSLGPRAKGVFVLVADQPLLDREALRAFGAGRLLAEANATRLDIPGVNDDIDTPEDWCRIREAIIRTGLQARQFQG